MAFAGEGYWRNAVVVFLCLEGLTAKVVDVVEDQTVLLSLAFDTKIMDLKSNFFFFFCLLTLAAEVMDRKIKLFCLVALF